MLRRREPVVTIKQGEPVVRLVPTEDQATDVFDYMAGRARAIGDIVGPVTAPEDWENG